MTMWSIVRRTQGPLFLDASTHGMIDSHNGARSGVGFQEAVEPRQEVLGAMVLGQGFGLFFGNRSLLNAQSNSKL